jgi:hypothetical protein
VESRKIDAKKETPASPERREFLRIGATLLLAAAAGCRGFYSCPTESVVFNQNNRRNLSAQELGFVRGETSYPDAEYEMERRGLTHIAKDTNVTGDARISALTADYQHYVHIFVDGKYETSLELEIAQGEYPHRYALRVANIPGDGFLVMALIRDAIGIEPTRLFMVPYSNGEFGEPLRADLTGLENEHNGLQRPLFVGYDLGEGITFIARDREGVPWENGYILRWENGQITKRPVPFLELMQCSCVSDWAEGNEEE